MASEHKSIFNTPVEHKSSNEVHHVTSIKEYQERLDAAQAAGRVVCVDFFAQWCGPCKAIAPELARLAEKTPDVDFLKVDVDDLAEIASEAGIEAMPTFKFYYNGEEIGSVRGANLKNITTALDKAVKYSK